MIIGRENRTLALSLVGHSWQSLLSEQLNTLNTCALQPLPAPHILWHAFGPGEQRLWQRRFSFKGSVPNAESPLAVRLDSNALMELSTLLNYHEMFLFF